MNKQQVWGDNVSVDKVLSARRHQAFESMSTLYKRQAIGHPTKKPSCRYRLAVSATHHSYSGHA